MKIILYYLFMFLGATCLSGATLSAQTIIDQTDNLSTAWYIKDLNGEPVEYFEIDSAGTTTRIDVVGSTNIFNTTQIEISRDSATGIGFSIFTAFNGTRKLTDNITVNLADFFLDFGTASYGIDLTYDTTNGFFSKGLYELFEEDKIASWSFFENYPGPDANNQGPHFGGSYLDSNGKDNIAYVDFKQTSENYKGDITGFNQNGTTGSYTYDFTIGNELLKTMDMNYLSSFDFMFGTAECANDVIIGRSTVPEPSTMILLGLGLLGFSAASRKKRLK
ncbi:hypothetical protein HRM2_25520 [Desulforapulum autotrophicum HRM2]|uniref:Ice-binding protein C-terminal domain-containing protein n=1 Tax=Desulforapulum autotrophicum (strain ATCC 43914 / DSM 3382 / VKM B-1955 / HRM2) TaxID=177437 RepID=C0QGZ7_DESAH|nr:PEP-CTERM sorting domain-containing protein [Desulforapulum autotrophicum]ACN15646.1 hypothetical protein HRM2_25520 [Desulforapulum autotrophicum HRM2]